MFKKLVLTVLFIFFVTGSALALGKWEPVTAWDHKRVQDLFMQKVGKTSEKIKVVRKYVFDNLCIVRFISGCDDEFIDAAILWRREKIEDVWEIKLLSRVEGMRIVLMLQTWEPIII